MCDTQICLTESDLHSDKITHFDMFQFCVLILSYFLPSHTHIAKHIAVIARHRRTAEQRCCTLFTLQQQIYKFLQVVEEEWR